MHAVSFSKFNKLCKFYKQIVLPDGLGGHVIQWYEACQAWGQIITIIPDRKAQRAKQAHPWTHRMNTRYSGLIKPYMKLIYYPRVKPAAQNKIDESRVKIDEEPATIDKGQEYILDKVINIDEKDEFLEIMLIRVDQ